MSLKVKEFCEARDWDRFHTPKDLAIGVVTEASELLELFRFLNSEQEHELLRDPHKKVAVGEELADVLFFLLRFSERYKFDLAYELECKMKKNAEKYPVAKSHGKNLKYTEL